MERKRVIPPPPRFGFYQGVLRKEKKAQHFLNFLKFVLHLGHKGHICEQCSGVQKVPPIEKNLENWVPTPLWARWHTGESEWNRQSRFHSLCVTVPMFMLQHGVVSICIDTGPYARSYGRLWWNLKASRSLININTAYYNAARRNIENWQMLRKKVNLSDAN